MLDFQKKKRIRKILYSPIVLLLLAIAFVLLFRGTLSVYKKEKLSLQNLNQNKTELEKIISRKGSIALALNYLNTEEGIEAEIRSKFRAVKEGEKVSVIIDEQNVETTTIATTTKKSFWYKIFTWF